MTNVLPLLMFCLLFTGGLALEAEEDERGERVLGFARYTTRTAIKLTTATTTVPFTCVNGAMTGNCNRRKLRKFASFRDKISSPPESEYRALSGSLTQDPVDDPPSDPEKQKIALFVWSTSSVTITITSTSTNTATTFSVSYICSVVGASYPPACG